MLCSSPVWCQVWMSIRLATTSASTVSTGESLFFFHWAAPWNPQTMMEPKTITNPTTMITNTIPNIVSKLSKPYGS